MAKVILVVTVDRDVFNQIEKGKGIASRSAYVNHLLRKILGIKK